LELRQEIMRRWPRPSPPTELFRSMASTTTSTAQEAISSSKYVSFIVAIYKFADNGVSCMCIEYTLW
jgi:hypothetical protein